MEIQANPGIDVDVDTNLGISQQGEAPVSPPSTQVYEANVYEPGVYE